MNNEMRLMRLCSGTCTAEQFARIDAVLEGKSIHAEPVDTRLLTLTAAAKALGLSRMSIFRMARDGRLPVVETRAGRRRIPAAALQNLVRTAVF